MANSIIKQSERVRTQTCAHGATVSFPLKSDGIYIGISGTWNNATVAFITGTPDVVNLHTYDKLVFGGSSNTLTLTNNLSSGSVKVSVIEID